MRRSIVALVLFSILSASVLDAASREPVRARNAMVASSSALASQVGVDVLRRGGNAVDAAVAVAFALAVTWPSAGNLGGGGFMLIRRADGTAEIIDYRERAPLAATRTMYLDAEGNVVDGASTNGHRAVAVPGTVAGLALAHERHGTMKWRGLVEPARRLAAVGFTVDHHLASSLRSKRNVERLSRFPESARIFLRGGTPYEPGERFRQPDLAATLERIRDEGGRELYAGKTARLIVEEMKRGGGLIALDDLKQYEPTLRSPMVGTYRGTEIMTMPPPSSGGIALLQMLQMLEPVDLASLGHNSSAYMHRLVETMRRAFADRAQHLGDADFVRVPVRGLTSREYANALRATIDPDRVTPSDRVRAGDPLPYESPETTHFTIVDAAGNVVSNTYTLNNSYGSGVTATGTGILLNNEMDDFTVKAGARNLYGLVQGEGNAIEPRKRPLSSMTPTIVLRDGKVWFAIGSPGGPTIISTLLQVILNVIDHGMHLQEAIDAPRIHHQWLPDEIEWEPRGVNPDTRQKLEAMGHRFREKAEEMGDVEGVMIDPKTGLRLGASDPRSGGAAVGD